MPKSTVRKKKVYTPPADLRPTSIAANKQPSPMWVGLTAVLLIFFGIGWLVTFYLSDQIPDWQNDWFYCNYHQGQLRRVRLAPGSFDRIVFEEVVKAGCSFDVATGPDGALYYSDAKGIYRIRQSAAAADVLPAVKNTDPH